MSDSRKPSRPKGSANSRRAASGAGGAKRAPSGGHRGSSAGGRSAQSHQSRTAGHRGAPHGGSDGRGAKKKPARGTGESHTGRGGKRAAAEPARRGGAGHARRSEGGRASGGGRGDNQPRGDRFRRNEPRPRRGPDRGFVPRGTSAAARKGPRDPLIEEIRAATPRAKQEAAIAAFEHARELLQRGRDGAAADAAADAKRLAPRSGAVRELHGVALYRSGRYRDALRELQAYRRMTGRLDQNHLIADSYRGLGMPDKAVPVALEAVRSRLRDEPRAEAAIVGASALADLGRFDEALGLLRGFPGRRDEADPWELRVWYVAGDVLERSGRPSEAAEEFRKIVRYDAGAFDAAERLAALTG